MVTVKESTGPATEVSAPEAARRIDVRAYAHFATASLYHSYSDRLLLMARGLLPESAGKTVAERMAFAKESEAFWKEAVENYEQVLAADPKAAEPARDLARGSFDRNDSAAGLRWLERAVEIDPGDFVTVSELGEACQKENRARAAIRCYQLAERARPEQKKTELLPIILLKLAGLQEAERQFSDAAASYQRFIDLTRGSIEAYQANDALVRLIRNPGPVWRKLGGLYLQANRPKEAADALREAMKLQPAATDVLLELAAADLAAGNTEQALDSCQRYLTLEPARADGYTLLVEIYRKAGQLDKAVSTAEQALKEKPSFYQMHYQLGQVWEQKNETDKAVAEYSVIVRERRPFVPAYLRLVAIERQRKEPGKALAVLSAGLVAGIHDDAFYAILDDEVQKAAKDPAAVERFKSAVAEKDRDFAFHYILGRLHYDRKNYAEAAKSDEQVVKLAPDFPYGHIRLAQVYRVMDRPQEAVRVLKAEVDRNPADLTAWRFLADTQASIGDFVAAIDSMKQAVSLNEAEAGNSAYLASLMVRAGRADEAEKYLENGLAGHPDESERWTYQLAAFYIDRNRKVERAPVILLDALKKNPDSLLLNLTLGTAYVRLGRTADAVAALNEALRIDPKNAYAREQLSQAYERAGDFDRAERTLRDLLKSDPKEESSAVALGRFLVRTRRGVAEGLKLVEQAARTKPDDVSGKLLLGATYLSAGKHEQAAKLLGEVLKTDPRNTLAQIELAAACDELGRFDEAEKELKAVLAREPGNSQAANALGYMYADKAIRMDEARRLVQQALDQEPENPAYIDSMGWVLFREGKFAEALDFLTRAFARERDAVIAEHVGDACVKLGKNDLALRNYEEAAKIDPDSKTVFRKIKLLKAGKDPLVEGK